jgi:hypothetical protein
VCLLYPRVRLPACYGAVLCREGRQGPSTSSCFLLSKQTEVRKGRRGGGREGGRARVIAMTSQYGWRVTTKCRRKHIIGLGRYDGIKIVPWPHPIGEEGQLPLVSVSADGIHCGNSKHGPTIRNCVVRNTPDDPIAIHGDS